MRIDLRGVGIEHGAAASAAIAESAGASKVGGFLGRRAYAGHNGLTGTAALSFTFMGVRFDRFSPPLSPLFSG